MIDVVRYTIYHSPNAYLGSVLAARRFAGLPARLVRRPICVPRERGVKIADLVGGREPERRTSYHREDCARWAARLGVELRFLPPGEFEARAARWATSPLAREELPARAYYAALGTGCEERLDEALFRAAWVDSLDVNDEAVVRRAAAQAGLDPDDLLGRARGEASGRALAEAFAAFERDGCPGVPTFVVAGERYWGKDRVEMLAERLAELGAAERAAAAGAGPARGAAGSAASETGDCAVRPFEERDAEGVTRLWLEVFADDPPRNAPARLLAELRRTTAATLLVGEVAGRVVATVVAAYDGHRGWIYHLATDPGARRRGLGRAMLRAAETHLRARGCAKLNLQVRGTNSGVVAFYERLGFAREDRLSLGKALV